jgi:hypothetical protein
VLFATGVTLVLVPALYLIAEDLSAFKSRFLARNQRHQGETPRTS